MAAGVFLKNIISENEKKNTVRAENQVKDDFRFTTEGSGKTKVLFIGNSITRHGPAPEIGWFGDYGMAASSREKDYVHVTASLLDEPLGSITIGIAQLADWERNYAEEGILSRLYQKAQAFRADIVIVRIGENMAPDAAPACRPYFEEMIRFFAHKAHTVVVTNSFWRNDARDKMLQELALGNGYIFCSISGLESDRRNMALDEYEHRGVAGHPSDLGMKAIAERIADAVVGKENF